MWIVIIITVITILIIVTLCTWWNIGDIEEEAQEDEELIEREGKNYCRNCGNELEKDEYYCKKCGWPDDILVNNNHLIHNMSNYVVYSNEINAGLVIISFLIPLIGIILAIIDRDTRPRESSACAKAASISIVLSIIIVLILFRFVIKGK